tara:strand:- start:9201 stop:10844 length:1644 start_codon:yes stop_codon:yes gene_type:complete
MELPYIEIAGRRIGADHPPYIIAELSANHNGKLENALRIIEEAKQAGAEAIKLQTYRPDTITLDCDNDDFKIKGGLWGGRTLYELYEEAHMPWEWHKPLFDHARKLGITIFSSPFDTTAVDLLEELDAPAYKIASFEAVDLPLIEYVAKTGKPMIISTGMANVDEIQEAIDAALGAGCKQLAILQCVSGYPAPPEDYNLRTILDMIERFGLVAGLSDHTIDNTTAITSVALGASLIEKHFTLDRNGGGPDDSFSLEPAEFAALCRDAKIAWQALGQVDYGRKPSEQGNVQFRRSLYFVKDLKEGDVITEDAVRSVRPGYGMAPKHYARVIGSKSAFPIKKNTPVLQKHLELVNNNVYMEKLEFKGERNYLQGGDIFNALNQYFKKIETGFLSTLSFKDFSKKQLKLCFKKPSLDNVIAKGGWEGDKGKISFWIVETDEPVENRYEYSENMITDECRFNGNSVLAQGCRLYSIIENIIALTKKLNYQLVPDVNGKWVFSQVDLDKPLPQKYSIIEIEQVSVTVKKYSRNLIKVDGLSFGEIRFMVAMI